VAETETPNRGYRLIDLAYRPNGPGAINDLATDVDTDVAGLSKRLDDSYATASAAASAAMGTARIATQPDSAHVYVVDGALSRPAAWNPVPFENPASYARSGMRSGALPTRIYILRDGRYRFEPLFIWEANTDGSTGSGVRAATIRINSAGSYSNNAGVNLTREWTEPATGRDATILAIPPFTVLLAQGDYVEAYATSTQANLATVAMRGGRLGTQLDMQWVGSDPRAAVT